ncbi:hypothetical protein ACIHCV_22185 [Streptomyces sp. NPDC051956]|uniref:hypothetical protein n=1 Tax=Streptomyces sp. NPDC051956 TaxID=3365677 RepID=UPI0037D889D0
MIRDRDVRHPAAFDAVLHVEGIEAVQSGVRIPRMNAITERRVRACRTELLDRTLSGTYKVDFEDANAVSSPAGGFDVVTMRLVYTFMSDKKLWPGGCPACCGPAARGHVGAWVRATERRQQ